MRRFHALLLGVVLLVGAAACNADVQENTSDKTGGDAPSNCTVVDISTSPEKLDLLTALAESFNGSDRAEIDGKCAFVRVYRTSSGLAASLLVDGWPDEEENGARPTVWSPSASSWGAVVNQRLADGGDEAIVPSDATPFMLTPLVIAMPKPMADALGYPQNPVGWADLVALAREPAGWGSKGHPEWGPFKLGKTNPNFSTSGLSSTIAQYYAATAKTSGLTLEDVNRPDVDQFMRQVESSVVHYGDTTLTFLNNLYRADRAGVGLTYISAVAVEETSLVSYNKGNPDGVLDPGEEPRAPRVPLVAIYPKEGTLFSDNPFFVLDAPWVNAAQKKAARAFETFVQRPENQRKVLQFGFRPGNPQVDVTEPISARYGADPAQPSTTLGVPEPAVLVRLIEKWGEQRKAARVLIVIDVSGSMGEQVLGDQRKMDLARQAAIEALDQFKPEDEVGLRIFTTNISPEPPNDYRDLLPIKPISEQREEMARRIATLEPLSGTPLYTVSKDSVEFMKKGYVPDRINAVVLLSDGRNEDDYTDLNATLQALRGGAEGQSEKPVRLFTIAFGADADKPTLKRLAEATSATSYDASDVKAIDRVFTAVVSNF